MIQSTLFSEENKDLLHEKSLAILERTGIQFNHPDALALLKKHGARIEGITAYIPPDLVNDSLKRCPSSFRFDARNPEKSVEFGSKDSFLVLPNLGPVFIQEADGHRRYGQMQDFVNITRLSQASPVIDVVGSCPIDTADIDPETKFLKMLYESFYHSDKPVQCCTGTPDQTDRQIEFMKIAFEDSKIMSDKIITGTSLSPLSPMAYSEDAAYAIMAYGRERQMIIIANAPMSGISAPVSIFGTCLTINVEFLAGMVLAQCAGENVPVVYATTASAGNLRNASYVTGIPETTLLNCFAAQMGGYYNIPTRSVGAVTDSKVLDMQAGYESMQSMMMAGLSGIDALYETLGTLDSLMAVSYEKFMVDQELISRVKRIAKGVNCSVEKLFVEDIESVGSDGNFLTLPSTFDGCRQRWVPEVSNWWTYEKWQKDGGIDVLETAREKYQTVLEQDESCFLDGGLQKSLLGYIEKQ